MKPNTEIARRAFEQIIMHLLIKAPYFGLLLKSIPILENKKIPLLLVGRGYLEINPQNFLKLPKKDQIFVILHALTHLTLLHPFRISTLSRSHKICPRILNYFAEFLVDRKITEIIDPLYIIPKTKLPLNLGSLLLGEPSIEDIAKTISRNTNLQEKIKQILKNELIKNKQTMLRTIPIPDIEIEQTPKSLTIIKPGSKQIMEELQKGLPKMLESLTKVIVDAYVTAKQAGLVPGWLERIVNSLLEPKIDWRALLRYSLRTSFGKRIKRTYSRPNKKLMVNNYLLFPSKRYYGGAKALVLVDTSGSISEDTLSLFFSEIYGIFRFGGVKNITVLPWDANVHDPLKIRSIADFTKIRVVGMGGTRLLPAIKRALDMADQETITIIFSDFEIAELSSEKELDELKKMMIKLAKRSLKAIMVTTSKQLPIPYWDLIKLV